jgi:hypothetical protein
MPYPVEQVLNTAQIRKRPKRLRILQFTLAACAVLIALMGILPAVVPMTVVTVFALVLMLRKQEHISDVSLGHGTIRWKSPDDRFVERPFSDIVAGWHEPSRDGQQHLVFLLETGEKIVAIVDDVPTARRCLQHANVDVHQRALLIETCAGWTRLLSIFAALVSGSVSMALGLCTLIAFMMAPWVGLMMVIPLAIAFASTIMLLRPVDSTQVVIGFDGIAVHSEVEDRFISYREIISVHRERRAVILGLRNGDRVSLSGPSVRSWQLRAAVSRINDALGQHHTSAATHRTRATLLRGETPFVAWRESLLAKLHGDVTYRSEPLDANELTAVVDDPTADLDQRVAAAMLIAHDHSQNDALTHVRVAADSTASEILRNTLERVLRNDLDEVAWLRLERVGRRRRDA